jgi:hypothetical protein
LRAFDARNRGDGEPGVVGERFLGAALLLAGCAQDLRQVPIGACLRTHPSRFTATSPLNKARHCWYDQAGTQVLGGHGEGCRYWRPADAHDPL